jgi:hypothetical protein
MLRIVLLAAGLVSGPADRTFENIVPALAYGPDCSSVVEVRNLGSRALTVDIEGHRSSGALVALAGHPELSARLGPGEAASFRLDITEQTSGAWVKVRERMHGEGATPVVAVSAAAECIEGNRLRSGRRDVAFPMRNPWFSSDVAGMKDGVLSMLNVSPAAATASVCYSAGSYYALPGVASLQPVCSNLYTVQVPPFGSREFPLSRDGSSQFTVRTSGDAVVLVVLKPLGDSVRVYTVDSSIHFEEVK